MKMNPLTQEEAIYLNKNNELTLEMILNLKSKDFKEWGHEYLKTEDVKFDNWTFRGSYSRWANEITGNYLRALMRTERYNPLKVTNSLSPVIGPVKGKKLGFTNKFVAFIHDMYLHTMTNTIDSEEDFIEYAVSKGMKVTTSRLSGLFSSKETQFAYDVLRSFNNFNKSEK